jgi:sec-independent protein translocase protein TatA
VFAGFGPTELIIVIVIVLLIFGPKRLPGLGKSIGGALREFKESVTSRHDADEDDGDRAQLDPAAPAQTTPEREPERERTPQS